MNRINLLDNRITLINGDSAEILKKVKPECVDLTVTSPPYDNLRAYNGFVFDFESIARELYRVTKAGGTVVWIVGDATIDGDETCTSFKQALFFKSIGFKLADTMIYQMPGTGAKGSRNTYWQSFEYMFVFSKGKQRTHNLLRDKPNKRSGTVVTRGRLRVDGTVKDTNRRVVDDYGIRTNIWSVLGGNNGDDRTGHPAVFPESLARDHILTWSNENDVVLDPFMGSGTTAKMAILANRRFIGIELSEQYFNDICIKRCEEAINARQ